jgi:23S rRNA (uridine2552-2'-O)-methyltransferase
VKSATTDNLRARSAYKLIEINDKYKILSKTNNNNHNGDMFVIDLGSTPGGWSLVASRYVDISKGGLLLSIDLLPMEHIPGN